jgi:hypothetical protein
MRPNQQNRNRNRNRNRHRGGHGGGGGGNGANKVFDSNGPDVKVRGTAQTIAEKYMQLGRDAQSSGDTVMAESYYQFADHYYRVWLAAQPAGQPIQFSRRMGEEDFEDEAPEGAAAEGEDEGGTAEGETVEGAEPSGEQMADANGQPQGEGGFQPRQGRERFNREGNRDNNRDNNGNGRFNRRWPRRFDRNAQDGQPQGEGQDGNEQRLERQERFERQERSERPERFERQEREERQPREAEAADQGNWEAPSFLKRPAPAVGEEGDAETPRPRVRRPARAEAPPADEPAGE